MGPRADPGISRLHKITIGETDSRDRQSKTVQHHSKQRWNTHPNRTPTRPAVRRAIPLLRNALRPEPQRSVRFPITPAGRTCWAGA